MLISNNKWINVPKYDLQQNDEPHLTTGETK